MKELTGVERRFVAEYLVDFNAAAALRRIGWQGKRVSENGYRFTRRPHVRAAIEAGIRRIEAHTTLSSVRTLEEVCRIALADPRRLLNVDGSVKGLHELDDDTARAVSSVKVTTKPGRDGEPPTVVQEVKFWDKNRALEQLLKVLGRIPDTPQLVQNTLILNSPGAQDKAHFHALENQLRAVLGQEPLPDLPSTDELADSNRDQVADDWDRVIEAAQWPDPEELDDAFS